MEIRIVQKFEKNAGVIGQGEFVGRVHVVNIYNWPFTKERTLCGEIIYDSSVEEETIGFDWLDTDKEVDCPECKKELWYRQLQNIAIEEGYDGVDDVINQLTAEAIMNNYYSRGVDPYEAFSLIEEEIFDVGT